MCPLKPGVFGVSPYTRQAASGNQEYKHPRTTTPTKMVGGVNLVGYVGGRGNLLNRFVYVCTTSAYILVY